MARNEKKREKNFWDSEFGRKRIVGLDGLWKWNLVLLCALSSLACESLLVTFARDSASVNVVLGIVSRTKVKAMRFAKRRGIKKLSPSQPSSNIPYRIEQHDHDLILADWESEKYI